MPRWQATLSAIAAAAAAILIAQPACAGNGKDVLRGAVIGGAGGAAVGAVVPGVSVGTGAAIGAGGGALIGATKKNRHHYRDRDGRYRDGRPRYD